MADVKITALTAISANPVNPATFPMPMVDLLDTSMAASGTTKKVTVNQILGAGGTATLASATITGALTVDTTTLVVNPSGYADRVGIGTATPTASLQVANGSIRLTDGYQLEFGGTTNSISGSTASNNLVFYTNNLERYSINSTGVSSWSVAGATAMTLNSNGLGIGASPSAKVHISDNTGSPELRINGAATSAAGPYMTFYKNNVRKTLVGQEAVLIGTGTSDAFGFYNDGAFDFKWFIGSSTPAMTLDASGNLLVGTTSLIFGTPAGSLNIAGANSQQIVIRNTGATAGNFWRQAVDSGNTFYILNHSSAGVSITSGATSWSAVSDERLKDIIEPISNAIAKVGSLRSVIGKYKNDETNIRRSFLIAQDVQSVLPEAVDSSNPNELGLRYTEVIPLLVAAIKELTARVQTLEAR